MEKWLDGLSSTHRDVDFVLEGKNNEHTVSVFRT